jgi:hypothetical protein
MKLLPGKLYKLVTDASFWPATSYYDIKEKLFVWKDNQGNEHRYSNKCLSQNDIILYLGNRYDLGPGAFGTLYKVLYKDMVGYLFLFKADNSRLTIVE